MVLNLIFVMIPCNSQILSCGGRFLAPRPRNALLSFASTRTGPKIIKFMVPDPDQPDYILPWLDQNNL